MGTELAAKTNTAEFSSKLDKFSGLESIQMILPRLSERTLIAIAKRGRSPRKKVRGKKVKMRLRRIRLPDKQTHLITKSLRMLSLSSLTHGVQILMMLNTRSSLMSLIESSSTLDNKIALLMMCLHELVFT